METIIKENKIFDVKLLPLHLACATDDLRPNGSLIEIRNKIAGATNYHVLVKIDLTKCSPFTKDMLEILEGKFIHKEVWKEMVKCDELQVDDQFIYFTKNGITKMFEYNSPQGEFFKIDSIIIQIKEAGEEAKKIISYRPKLITMLGKVFDTDQLFFSFSKENNGTIVFPYNESGMFAVLMPMHTEQIEPRYFFI